MILLFALLKVMIVFSVILTNLIIFASSQQVVVNLPNGTISGVTGNTGQGATYYAFQKIPYAKPPIGNLRFEPPQTAEAWNGTRDGSTWDVSCYQVSGDNDQESEDCLFLSIFTTENPNNITVLKPVWIYIHGGAFVGGVGGVSPVYVLDFDIVYVSLNYRLGPFGFLSTGDTVIPGNNGLKDQQLAIRYVKENIKLFGGDPDKITIGGQSAGASSVSFQLLNTDNAGLFRGVIQESGTYLNPWSLQKEARELAFQTASFINESYSSITDTTELANVLKSVPARQLDAASARVWNEIGNTVSEGFAYAPVIEVPHEGAFLTEKMYQKLRKGDFLNVSTLIGFNSEEQIGNAADLNSLRNVAESYDTWPTALVPLDMNLSDNVTAQQAAALSLKSLYTNETFIDNLGSVIRYQSDSFFTKSVIRQAQVQAKYGPVYLYEFSYHGDLGHQPIYIEGAERVGHSEELRYLYGDGSDRSQWNEPDLETHYRMIELFTNFVKDLDPTSEQTQHVNLTWTPVASSGEIITYLNINGTLQVQDGPRGDTYRGWVEVYDSLNIEDILDTY